ncbi:hypothetical protein D3C86_2067360 [compost metagenome]
MIVAAFDQRFDNCVHIDVLVDDRGRYTTMLECAARSWRQFRSQRPPYPRRSNEAEEGDPRVYNQCFGQRPIGGQ